MRYEVSNQALSSLFNAIIFARAVEDHSRRLSYWHGQERQSEPGILLQMWGSTDPRLTISELFLRAIRQIVGGQNVPSYLIDETELAPFDPLDRETISALLADFYRNKYAPYEYDFSVMSQHALSRIYEHYVSVLRVAGVEESPQLTIFPRLPEEVKSKAYGSVYTPQYIARFFAKYLREQMPPVVFKRILATDPACGSGIFLRTLLELQFESLENEITEDRVELAFTSVLGLDIDGNACRATVLSLALLHLVLIDSFPDALNVIPADAIRYYQEHPELRESFDAVVANPPFVSLDVQASSTREHVSHFMAKYASGRIDKYLTFLRIGLELLKPGGYGLFVLPHSFLLAKSAREMRASIIEKCWIRCLADLSAIRVFGDVGSYIILLIFQKKLVGLEAPPATVVKCQDSVGSALQDALEGRHIEKAAYSVYDVTQASIAADEWIVSPPTESSLKRKFETLPALRDFLDVHQGFTSGNDEVFIVSSEQVPQGEEELFVPFLPDREMQPYTVPPGTSRYLFYPYVAGQLIDESALRKRFPATWAYLRSNKRQLESRRTVRNGEVAWWRPTRPRKPEHMMRPKIISPHLVLVPRFSLDLQGRYAVSRCPLLYPKDTGAERDLLRYFVAILNSTACFWYIATHSHVYQRGYAMLEVKTLIRTPVPDPARVPLKSLRQLLKLVDKRLSSSGTLALDLERQIDATVADLYALSSEERRALGMET